MGANDRSLDRSLVTLSRRSYLEDTDAATHERHLALLAGVPKAERLTRMFALSALVRTLAWAGAMRQAGTDAPDVVRARFLAKLYGVDPAPALQDLLARL